MIGTESERIDDIKRLYPVWEEHTLWTCFERSVKRFSDKEYVVNESECYTYASMHKKAVTVAKSLMALGVKPGDHVLCLMKNCTEYLALLFAISAVGAVKVPVNPGLGRFELTHIINQSDAKWIIGEQVMDSDLLSSCPNVKKLVVKNTNFFYQAQNVLYWNDFLELAATISDEAFERLSLEVQNPDHLSDILYTSGSTSMPKGVMITHDMILRSGYATCLTRRMEIGRRMYVPLPFFHIFAYLEGIVPIMLCGGTLIISQLKFCASQALVLMKTKKANDIICILNMMEKILMEGKPKAEDYPDMHAAYFSPTHPHWIWQACREGFGIQDVTTGFGMTETVSAVTYTSTTDYIDILKNCHGRIKDGGCAVKTGASPEWIEIKICDPDTGEEVENGQSGEICCRGPVITSGYYRNPEATERAFYKDGWFRTGDSGFWRAGKLSYISRMDEIYKVNGENVSPQLIINVIAQCDCVKAVEVVGIPHPRYKTVGVAFLDVFEDTLDVRNEIKQYCRCNLAKFQIPKYFIFSDNQIWPRTGSQKISRKELKKIAEELVSRNLEHEYIEYY